MKTPKKNTEILEKIPVITLEMREKTAIEIVKSRTDMKNSTVFDITLAGKRIIISNLTGLKCSKCSEAAFDAHSTKIIENFT